MLGSYVLFIVLPYFVFFSKGASARDCEFYGAVWTWAHSF